MKIILFLMLILCVSNTLGAYSGTYGKVDNLEIGFDMFWSFLLNLAPFLFYIIAGIGVLYLMYKSGLF